MDITIKKIDWKEVKLDNFTKYLVSAGEGIFTSFVKVKVVGSDDRLTPTNMGDGMRCMYFTSPSDKIVLVNDAYCIYEMIVSVS